MTLPLSSADAIVSEYFLPPVGWQTAITDAPEKDIWIWGGRQIGKSRTCISMQSTDVLAGGRNVYACPDKESADNNWTDIANAFVALGKEVRVNKVERGVIELRSPVTGRIGQYRRYTAQQRKARGGAQRLRGAHVHSILFDELQMALNSEKYYAAASALTLTTRGREYVCMTSPSDPVQMTECKWIFEKFDAAGLLNGAGTEKATYVRSPDGFPNTLFIRQPTVPHVLAPILQALAIMNDDPDATQPSAFWVRRAEDSLNAIRGKIGETEFTCEYLCGAEADRTGMVMDEWSDDLTTRDAEYDATLPVYWCADGGQGFAASVVLFFQVRQVQVGSESVTQFVFFDELHTFDYEQGGELMLANAMQFSVDPHHQHDLIHDVESVRVRPYTLPTTVYPDIHAKDLIKGCEDIGLDHREAAYAKWTQARTMNYLLRSGRMLIHPRCELLRSNFSAWNRTGDGMPSESNCDAAQACAYGVLNYLVESGEGIEAVEKARHILDQHKGEKRDMVELLYL